MFGWLPKFVEFFQFRRKYQERKQREELIANFARLLHSLTVGQTATVSFGVNGSKSQRGSILLRVTKTKDWYEVYVYTGGKWERTEFSNPQYVQGRGLPRLIDGIQVTSMSSNDFVETVLGI